ncbi:MAG: AAA family ATPase [Polyangiaceae bacterium]|nr:AAA family ATPase [Polyangiaceae bacterium]
MWTRLSIKDFRLLRDVTIDFEAGTPVVLIGPNASGKSSVLQVLGLLHRCGVVGFDAAVRELGWYVSAPEYATDIEICFGFRDEEHWRLPHVGQLRYNLCSGSSGLYDESLHAIDDSGTEARVMLNDMTNGRNELRLTNDQTGSPDLVQNPDSKLSFEVVRQAQLYPHLEVLRESLLGIRTYGGFLTTPLWERDPAETKVSVADGAILAPARALDRRGLNLVNALYYLKNSDDSGAWAELLRAFQAEFPFVKDLVFPADRGGRISVGWWDLRYPGHAFTAYDMSEGMLTYLCLLAAILSPTWTTILALDEPDRHLHPSALRRVVSLLEQASEKMAVVVATHSDRLLDALSDPAGSIRVCTPTDQGVRIEKLDREALESWRERYSISELRARGHLDPSNTDLDVPET